MSNSTLSIVKRDIEANYSPKLINLPEAPNAYLMALLVVGGVSIMSGAPLVAAGVALLCWEGLSPNNVDPEKLPEEESYLLALLEDKHPKTGETLDRVMRDCIAKCGGDRAIPSQVMSDLLPLAFLDPGNGCYVVDTGEKLLHVSTYAEARFCELFKAHTGRVLSPSKVAPMLGSSVTQLPPADQSTLTPVGNYTQLNAISVDSFEATTTTEATSVSGLFDWSLLNTRYDDYPHLMLLGKTGAGKTFLAERLGRFLDGSVLVITPKKKPSDFRDMSVVGMPYDFSTIASRISEIAQLVKDREAEMNRTGSDDFEPLNVILDEVPASVAGCKDEGFDVVKDLKFIIRTARTSKIRLIFLAQGSEVKTLGIEGEGSLRDNLTFIRLRGFAEPHANKIGGSVNQQVAAMERPATVEDLAADVNELTRLAAGCQLVNWQVAATTQPVDSKTHMGVEDAPRTSDESVKRVSAKLGTKIRDGKGDWLNLRTLVNTAFSNLEDRKLAEKMIDNTIEKGTLEYREETNANQTISKFVRVKLWV